MSLTQCDAEQVRRELLEDADANECCVSEFPTCVDSSSSQKNADAHRSDGCCLPFRRDGGEAVLGAVRAAEPAATVLLRGRAPMHVSKSFNYAMSYVVAYFSNVVRPIDLLLWKRTAELILTTSGGTPPAASEGELTDVDTIRKSLGGPESAERASGSSSLQFAEVQELVIRLAGRKPTWFSLRQLEADYGGRLHVNDVVLRLSATRLLPPELLDDGADGCSRKPSGLNLPSWGRGKRGVDATLAALLESPSPFFIEVIEGSDVITRAQPPRSSDAVPTSSSRSSTRSESRSVGTPNDTHDVNSAKSALFAVLSCARRKELREVAIQLKKTIVWPTVTGPDEAKRETSGSDVEGATSTTMAPVSVDPKTKQRSALLTIPNQKKEIIDFLAELGLRNRAAFATAWDAVIGPMCRLHPGLKRAFAVLFTLFHILTYNYGAGSIMAPLSSSNPPMPVTTILVLHSLQRVRLPMYGRMPLFLEPAQCSVPSGNSDVDEKARCGTPVQGNATAPKWRPEPIELFASTEDVEEYVAGCQLHAELFDVTSSMHANRRDPAYIAKVENLVSEAFRRIVQVERAGKETPAAGKATTVVHVGHRKRRRHNEGEMGESPPGDPRKLCAPSIHSLIREGGLRYQHLLPFLPKYRWMACVEHLVTLLILRKEWEKANAWLTVLLEEPVYTLEASGGGVAFWMCYRYQKRGEWWHRLALNTVQLGKQKEALRMVEDRLRSYDVEREMDSPAMKRRVRLLRAMWPADVAHENCRLDFEHRHFCRRADRVAMEQLLIRLHQPPRRWAPISLPLLSNTLLQPAIIHLHAQRDPFDSTRWHGGTGNLPPCRVEDYVLRWMCAGGGRRESGWDGLHCEGRWISYLARILLADVYYSTAVPIQGDRSGGAASRGEDEPPPRLESGSDAAATMWQKEWELQSVWLSPFQEAPLDVITSEGFASRRRHAIEAVLNFISMCSRDEFLAFIRARCRSSTRNHMDQRCAREGATERHSEMDLRDPAEGTYAGGASDASGGLDMISAEESSHSSSLLCTDSDDGEMAPCTLRELQQRNTDPEQTEETSPLRPAQSEVESVPRDCQVDVGDFPIQDIAACVPQKALGDLLRLLYLSPLPDGFSIKFSGFPDLVIWRQQPGEFVDPEFKLVEVKSPNDTLSTKQNTVLDTLLRCGFDASIVHITEVSPREPRQHGVPQRGSTRSAVKRLGGQLRRAGEPLRTRRPSMSLPGLSAHNPLTL